MRNPPPVGQAQTWQPRLHVRRRGPRAACRPFGSRRCSAAWHDESQAAEPQIRSRLLLTPVRGLQLIPRRSFDTTVKHATEILDRAPVDPSASHSQPPRHTPRAKRIEDEHSSSRRLRQGQSRTIRALHSSACMPSCLSTVQPQG
jgi:hypothetical protein